METIWSSLLLNSMKNGEPLTAVLGDIFCIFGI